MNKRRSLPRVWGITLFVLFLLIGIVLVVRWADLPKATFLPTELTPLSLDGVQKILVLAPHCDDETLGAGGLIQAAAQKGIEIRVAIATNGDGYRFATTEEFRKVYPTALDYIRMGEVRQKESLAALEKLGVQPQRVYFLSYPDRGTSPMMMKNWSSSDPYTSPYSKASKSPYPLTYNPSSVYAGEDYLADLESILDQYRPDLVVFPSPEDVHPDHWGLGAFTRLALSELSHHDPAYQPGQITYLVHRPDFPVVRGLNPAASLVPPPTLSSIYLDWLGWPLTLDQEIVKGNALRQYKSQWPLLKGLLVRFIRSNELFAPVTSSKLQEAVSGEVFDPGSWKNRLGAAIPPVQMDPTGDVLSHKVAPGTDLKAVYAARTPNGDLWFCARLHGRVLREVSYSLRLKSLTESGIRSFEAHTRPKPGQATLTRAGDYFCTTTSLKELGDPWAISVEATVESPDSLLPFDQTAWQIVDISTGR
ncbi:MAG: PIG-L deacetylase family protein [Bacteroidota bacterium]